MAMEMDTQQNHQLGANWASDNPFLDDAGMHPFQKWPAFHAATFSQSFTIPPSALIHGSLERYGQVTPPEELSPAEPRRDSHREDSIPFEVLKNEALFPHHRLQALQDFESSLASPQSPAQEPSSTRCRLTQVPANQEPTYPALSQTQAQFAGDAQPPKRKRGRPKSQVHMVESFTADGFPFQVSSARQSHLEKNRVAAHKCRQRKKEYTNLLEERARLFTTKNKALKENVAMLREDVLELKNEVLRHAGCGFWAVDEYLAQCAGDLLGLKPPVTTPGIDEASVSPKTITTALPPGDLHRISSEESTSSSAFFDSPNNDNDNYVGLDLYKEMVEDGVASA